MTVEGITNYTDAHQHISAALRDSQETVRALLDATTETALLVDTEGHILALNEVAYERLCNLAPVGAAGNRDDLLGQNVFDLFPPGLADQRKARNDAVIRSGVPARFEDERAGRWMDNTIYPIFGPDGCVAKLAVFSYDITDRKRTEVALERALLEEQERARRDPLTGALNHGAIVEELQRFVERSSEGLAVLIADLDGLKTINDTLGHPMGDAALVAVAETLLRDRAIVGRYGGDEFVVLLPGADRTRAEGYKQTVEAEFMNREIADEHRDVAIPVRASIGIAMHPEDSVAVNRLIELADSSMYAEKRRRPVVRPRRLAA